MPAELTGQNIVVLARRFNPSIISERWLLRNGIVQDDDLRDGAMQVPNLAKFPFKNAELLALPDRVQLTLVADGGQTEVDCFDQLISRLPETPYSAIGLNFFWVITSPIEETVAEFSNRLFQSDFSRRLGGSLLLGGYAGRTAMGGSELRMEIKPAQADDGTYDRLLANMNYHFDIPEEVEQTFQRVREAIALWGEAAADASRIAQELGA